MDCLLNIHDPLSRDGMVILSLSLTLPLLCGRIDFSLAALRHSEALKHGGWRTSGKMASIVNRDRRAAGASY